MFRSRAVELCERMDDPGCDPAMLANTYRQFALVNRLFTGWGGIFRRFLGPRLETGATVLDVGCGGGDLARRLARWAAARGTPVRVMAVDPDPRALEFARSRPPVPGVEYASARAEDLEREGARFDFVLSNHVLHHLADDEVVPFLETTAVLAGRAALHSDLRRLRAAWLAFGLTRPVFRRSFIVEDGLRSIRRSFTPAELDALLPAGWRLAAAPPFRNLLVFER